MVAPSESLRERSVLITGASSGIGAATAVALCARNPPQALALHYNSNAAGAEDTAKKCREAAPDVRVETFQADMGDEQAVQRLYDDVHTALGRVDAMFINAGNNGGSHLGPKGDIESLSVEQFRKTWEVNTLAPFILTRAALGEMAQRKWGRIVYCSSVAALTGGVVGPHYASSKSALHGMLRWTATRHAKDGITCNAVAPALIDQTGMIDSSKMDASTKSSLEGNIPIGRLGRVEECVDVILLLLTNAYISNKVWAVDGGWTMQ